MANWTPTALSALHHKLLALNARMVDIGEWQIPGWYTTPKEEIAHISKKVGISDFSHATKLNIQGNDVERLLRDINSNVPSLEVGRIWQGNLTTSELECHIVTARLSHDELLMLSTTEDTKILLDTMSEFLENCVHIVDVTSALCSIRVTGPRARKLMSRVTELDLRDSTFPDMSCARGKLSGIECTVLRYNIGGLTSFELYFSRDYGEYLWDSLTEAGSDMELIPYGVKATTDIISLGAG